MKTTIKTLHIKGMTCAACSANIERNISKEEGIVKASANLATGKLTVEYDPEQTNVEQFIKIIEKLGFQVEHHGFREITFL